MSGVFNPLRAHRRLEEARRTHGGRNWPATFADRLTEPLPSTRQLLRVMREGGFGVKDLSPAKDIPVARQPLPTVDTGQTGVTWVGHATYVLQMGGLTILTDPVWSEKIPGVKRRLTPVGVDWADLPTIDAVVISHNHYDHLDAPTFRRLPRTTPCLVPGALGFWFRKRGFKRVIELDWWETATLGGVTFEFVPAHHWSRRSLNDTCRTLWGGWMVSNGKTKVYFAGDTGYGGYFTEIGKRHADIAVALLPVGAYEPNWFMRPMHMSPPEAVQACGDLGAKRMATMHWGTFVLSAEPLLAPLHEARAAWEAAGRPRDDLWDLAIGESRVVPV
jgi:L-ascorbate metabolism protein UlaG (beta-lactamase superfamily)